MNSDFNANLVEKVFLNPAIEHGIRAYMEYKERGEFERIHTFEMHVIKALTIIYGEKAILLPYKIDNEKAFKCNLLMYNLKEVDMQRFIKYMNAYDEFIHNVKSGMKATGIITEIEHILMEMMELRSAKHPFTEEDFKEFDTIFNPLNGDLKNIKRVLVSDSGLLIKSWQDSKEKITDTQIRLMAINPNLLAPSEYAKYGYDIHEVAVHTEDEINYINNEILRAEYASKQKPLVARKKKVNPLTSGNIIVDCLLGVSILTTCILVVLLIITHLGGTV